MLPDRNGPTDSITLFAQVTESVLSPRRGSDVTSRSTLQYRPRLAPYSKKPRFHAHCSNPSHSQRDLPL
jgi:hypothetical protein